MMEHRSLPDDMIAQTAPVKASKHRWRKQHGRSWRPATCIKCGLLRTRPHSGYWTYQFGEQRWHYVAGPCPTEGAPELW
jgi:hypothetical protein